MHFRIHSYSVRSHEPVPQTVSQGGHPPKLKQQRTQRRQDHEHATQDGRFSFLLEEWVFQLALVVAVVSALVERGIAMSGGVIV